MTKTGHHSARCACLFCLDVGTALDLCGWLWLEYKRKVLSCLTFMVGCWLLLGCQVTSAKPPDPPPLPTLTITVNPTTIVQGSSSVLTVVAANATQVVVSDNIDSTTFNLPATGGTQSATPTATTTYTATATGPGGTTTAKAAVTVTAPSAPTVTIVASPVTVSQGSSSTLTVTATNATQVVISDNLDTTTFTLTATGGTQAVIPTTTTIYTATARGAGGTATAQATVTVNAIAPLAVLTERYDNARTGVNSAETMLTPSNVNDAGFGKLASYSIDGMTFAQPLYVQNVAIPNQGTFNVVYVATEHDSVYAFDADGKATAPLWQTSFIDPAAGITTVLQATVGSTIYPEIGITSTPVIDPDAGVLYVVPFTEENGTFVQRIHALSLSTGKDVNVPMEIAAPGFDPKVEAQRTSLLLVNSTLYIAFASHGDNGTFHGRILAYDPQTLILKNDWNVTPIGAQGGIWQSGCGLSADSSGHVYAATSNGTFDINNGGTDYGDSVVKLDADLSVLDYFTPFNQLTLDDDDIDLGSSGFLLIPGSSLGVVAGKGGTIYLVDTTNMGHFNSTIDNIVQELPGALGTGTEDLNFSTATFFNGNVYYIGSNDTLKQFSFDGSHLSATPVATSTHTYGKWSAQSAASANGTSNGILWVVEWLPSGADGVLRAYDPNNVGNEFYDSTQSGTRDTFGSATKFSVPTIANGKVYVGAATQLVIFGLL
jgi:hypothetical protein